VRAEKLGGAVELGEQRNWLETEELGGSSGTGWELRNWAGLETGRGLSNWV
jgi:hypothetical protein